MFDTILKAFKSKTVWLGLGVTILSWAQGVISDSGLTADQVSLAGTIIGAAIVTLRSLTTTSLSDK
jgi:hypothetical protein